MTKTFTKDDWFSVPGFDGFYEVNVDGVVRTWREVGRCPRAKEPKILKPCVRGSSRACVRMTDACGKKHDVTVARVMAEVFLGGVPKGMVAYHKDGNQQNNCLYNIGITEKKNVGKMFGAKMKRKPVLKVSKGGDILEVYKSVEDAFRKNYMSATQIERHLHKRVKEPFKFQDWTFVYDEEWFSE